MNDAPPPPQQIVCPVGCACSNHGPSLFEMAAKRKQYQKTKMLVAKAEQSKSAGNLDLIKSKALIKHTVGKSLIADACEHYLAALGHLNEIEEALINDTGGNSETDGSSNDTLLEQWTSLSVSVYLNLSLAGLLCEDYSSGLRSANKVLSLDPTNTKALYRSAKCHRGLDQFEDALLLLDRALQTSPKNKNVRQEKQSILTLLKKKKRKEIFARETAAGLAKLALNKEGKKKGNASPSIKEPGHWERTLTKDIQDKKEKRIKQNKQDAAARKKQESVGTPSSAADSVTMEDQVETIHQMVSRLKPTACGLNNGGLGPCTRAATATATATASSGAGTYYMWGQTTDLVHVLIVVPKQLKSSQMTITMKRNVCNVQYTTKNANTVDVLCLPLTRPTRVDDSAWVFEHKGLLHIELAKEKIDEWWENVTPAHPTIDVALCDSGGLLMADVPTQQKAAYDRAMYEEMQKSSEQREEEMKRVAMMDEWKKTRRKENKETEGTTSRNPKKKELYEHLKAQFPDVNIQVKGK